MFILIETRVSKNIRISRGLRHEIMTLKLVLRVKLFMARKELSSNMS